MKLRLILLMIICILLTACSSFAPPPTATPTLTPTQTATLTPTETPIPTATFTPPPPTETPDVIGDLMPTGAPAKSWKGIPIMPGAIAGDGNDQGYRFTINATVDEIQQYYDRELGKLGATPFAVGQGDGKDTVLVIYMLDDTPVSVMMMPSDGFVLVMIVK